MADARYVKLEGLDQPCLLVCADGSIPEELVIEQKTDVAGDERRRVVYRLQPSSAHDAEPVYVEVFDE